MIESELQKKCNEYLRLVGIHYYHLPKGRNNGQKKMGGGGLLDLLLWYKGNHYIIELKTPTGRLNDNQKEFIVKLAEQDFKVKVFDNFEDFKECIDHIIECEPLSWTW